MKRSLLFLAIISIANSVISQSITWTPTFGKDNDAVTITIDGTKGNQALNGFAGNVYIHTGVITTASTNAADWKYVKLGGTPNLFTTPQPTLLATSIGGSKWTFNITPDVRTFYGVPAGETILKISLLFRNADGTVVQRNSDGSDMYIPIYSTNLAARFTQPPYQPTFTPIPETIVKAVGDNMTFTGIANQASNLKLTLNGTQIQTATSATTITANPALTLSGTNKAVIEATLGANTVKDSFSFFVAGGVTVAALPAGVREGINYNANNTEATLVLFAPNKARISIIGEFAGSNWIESNTYQMNKTPDGNYWWKTITGLTSGTEYAYQYLVNGALKIADPYTEKTLDPNDQFIAPATYPGLKPYPVGQSGIVSVLQTNAPTYNWQVTNFARPNKKALVIYELLLRDFVATHDYATLKDTLGYLKKLGINTIELMPFNEFEGNESWGYNPSYFFAPDKYYGTKNALKAFIDAAHANGIAVVMDMVMNHVCGQSAQAMLYFNNATGKPTAENPWLNIDATHPFNVCNDFNHLATPTKYLVDRAVEHWLTEYKLDGFRWDLSKGFVQNVGSSWENYNTERINIWKRIYDVMQAKSAGSYCILEHLGNNDEEKELSNYGMMPWGKTTDPYNQFTMGFVNNSDFQGVIHSARGFANPFLVGYAESHDEERTNFKNLQFGNTSGTYAINTLQTALRREEMLAANLLTIPGPKMFWQFAELGYDLSINLCPNGTNSNNCRTDKKPIRWDYFTDINRKRLYDIYASLNNLRNLKPNAFANGTIEWGLGGNFKWLKVTEGSLKICVISNMDVTQTTGSVTFQNAGTWYDYLMGGTITATGGNQSFTLAPGEYHVYIDQNINGAVFTPVNNVNNPISNMRVVVYPNPVRTTALIEYDLPENGVVTMTMLNQAGQIVGNIYKGFKTKGTHNINLNSNGFVAQKLAPGVYMLQIEVNKNKRIEKVVIQ